jgi:hypothetical protein
VTAEIMGVSISSNSGIQLEEFNIAIGFIILCVKGFMCSTVVGTKPCVLHLLEIKGRGVRGLAGKETYTVQTINIISQWQYFLARCLFLCQSRFWFTVYLQASDIGEMHSLVLTIVVRVAF